jgi:nucleotide-binding universal stress UspA family protein
MFTKILVGLDGSPGSVRALEAATEIAQKFGASLHALSVIEPAARYAGTVGEVDETIHEGEIYMQKVQEAARRTASDRGVALETTIAVGHPARSLAAQTQTDDFDLVVIGQSGHSGVWGTFLGTTADKISHHATCSVLIVR